VISKALISTQHLLSFMNQSCEPSRVASKNKFVRSLFFVAGTITLVLGAVGIVLPILPTTPFLLLSLACYLRSSERMTHWMLNNKYFGTYIQNYKEGKGIPMKTKLFAISVLWITISISAFVLVPILVVQIILLVVAIGVTVHLVRLPTYRY
jgi:uncharacterized membrane protein YbaN (DUF454 family)